MHGIAGGRGGEYIERLRPFLAAHGPPGRDAGGETREPGRSSILRDRQEGLRHLLWPMTAARDLEPLLAHVTWVRTLALHLCADVHAAEDAAQDTWAMALRHGPRHLDGARAFLGRTLRNALAMSRRSARRRLRREKLAARAARSSRALLDADGRPSATVANPQDSDSLPAGSYELEIQNGNQRAYQGAITINPREVTKVRVRLP